MSKRTREESNVHKVNKKYRYFFSKGDKDFSKSGDITCFTGLDEPLPAQTVVNTVYNSGKWGEGRIDIGPFDDKSFKIGGTRKRKRKMKNKSKTLRRK